MLDRMNTPAPHWSTTVAAGNSKSFGAQCVEDAAHMQLPLAKAVRYASHAGAESGSCGAGLPTYQLNQPEAEHHA